MPALSPALAAVPERWAGVFAVYRYFVRARWEAEAADRMSDAEREAADRHRRTALEIRRIAEWRAQREGVDLAEAFDAIDQEERIL